MTNETVGDKPQVMPTVKWELAILLNLLFYWNGNLICQSFRHEWYQSESQVYVTILAKNLNENKLSVKYAENTVSWHFNSSLHSNR